MSLKVSKIIDFIFRNRVESEDRKYLSVNLFNHLSDTSTFVEVTASGSWIRNILADKFQTEVWSKNPNACLVFRTGDFAQNNFKTFIVTDQNVRQIRSEIKPRLNNCNYYLSLFFSDTTEDLSEHVVSYLRFVALGCSDVKITFGDTNQPDKNEACVEMIGEAFSDVLLFSTTLSFVNAMEELVQCNNHADLVKKITNHLQSNYN